MRGVLGCNKCRQRGCRACYEEPHDDEGDYSDLPDLVDVDGDDDNGGGYYGDDGGNYTDEEQLKVVPTVDSGITGTVITERFLVFVVIKKSSRSLRGVDERGITEQQFRL
eukprot:TRINITY_DN1972_c0_g3_i1.p4 TRINITY_DN1972_c0_g3~~TRINITY_DN1972_c0_g3_i1.p4  ORF type:complete len:110 (+),score=29.14 TRINITY_DN1972_c0_g3_i1:766-1095(+)